MAKVERTTRARLDATEIWLHIAEDSVDNADAFIDQIETRVRMLAENPSAGRLRPELGEGLRSFPHGNYLIFYRPIPDGIRLIRILHGGRDLGAILDG